MSTYRNRVGQRIGPWEIIADHKRTAHGKVVWRLRDATTGRDKYLRTQDVIKLDRKYGNQ